MEPADEPYEVAESLAIQGRLAEAGAALRRIPNIGDRRLVAAARCEEIADRLADSQPKAARWFYGRVIREYEAFAQSSGCALEGYERWGMVDAVKGKLSRISKGRRL